MITQFLFFYTVINLWILYIELLELHFGTFHILPGFLKIITPPLISFVLREVLGILVVVFIVNTF